MQMAAMARITLSPPCQRGMTRAAIPTGMITGDIRHSASDISSCGR
jgi:hypothetical protein